MQLCFDGDFHYHFPEEVEGFDYAVFAEHVAEYGEVGILFGAYVGDELPCHARMLPAILPQL